MIRANIKINLLAPDAKEWTHDRELDFVDRTDGDFTHTGVTAHSRTAKEIDQKSFGQIVCVMAEKNCSATLASSDLGKELIPRLAASCFDRHFLLSCKNTNVSRSNLDIE